MRGYGYLIALEAALLWGAAMGLLIGYGIWGAS